VWKIWKRGQNFAQARFLFGRLFFGLRNLLAQFFGLRNLRRSILPALLQFCNLLGSAVAARLQSFRGGDGLPALAVDEATKSFKTSAGFIPRWRSFSSTSARLSRTKFRSSILH
jgi:hypothetical protein